MGAPSVQVHFPAPFPSGENVDVMRLTCLAALVHYNLFVLDLRLGRRRRRRSRRGGGRHHRRSAGLRWRGCRDRRGRDGLYRGCDVSAVWGLCHCCSRSRCRGLRNGCRWNRSHGNGCCWTGSHGAGCRWNRSPALLQLELALRQPRLLEQQLRLPRAGCAGCRRSACRGRRRGNCRRTARLLRGRWSRSQFCGLRPSYAASWS